MTLKINGVPILNFMDLKRHFDPMDIYWHLEAFCGFAEVHCLPLSTLLTNKETATKYVAQYLTKEFWLKTIRSSNHYIDLSVKNQFDMIREDIFKDMIDPDDDEEDIAEAVKDFKREIEDADIYDKLTHISRLLGEQEALKKTISLLAICELAEIEPDQVDVSLWNEELRISGAVHKSENSTYISHTGQRAAVSGNVDYGSDITSFTYDQDVYLTTGAYVYKYWYHDEDLLVDGKCIKTVRIIAKSGSNRYASVKIELYSSKTKSLVQTVILKKDEYRYCNVSDGKIIKFLPILSISDELCVMRGELENPNLLIQARNAEAWPLNIDQVSSFVACEKGHGFLMVQNGKINAQFFKPAEDYFYKLRLEMVPLPVVEILVHEDRYFLLMEDGSVFTNEDGYISRKKVSLSDLNRCPIPVINGINAGEAVISESKKSLAIIDFRKGTNTVIFEGDGLDFEVKEQNGGLGIKLLKSM